METTVTFYGDVGIDPDHTVTRDFASTTERDTWFSAQGGTSYNANYYRLERGIELEETPDACRGFAYCKIDMHNNTTGEDYDTLYAFVESVQAVNDRVTRVTIRIDWFQVYCGIRGTVTLNRGFVKRKHIDGWNYDGDSDAFTPVKDVYPVDQVTGIYERAIYNWLVPYYDSSVVMQFVVVQATTASGSTQAVSYYAVPVAQGYEQGSPWKDVYDTDISATFIPMHKILDGTWINEITGSVPSGILSISLMFEQGIKFSSFELSGSICNVTFDSHRGWNRISGTNYAYFFWNADQTGRGFNLADECTITLLSNGMGTSVYPEPCEALNPVQITRVMTANGQMIYEVPDSVRLAVPQESRDLPFYMIPILSQSGCYDIGIISTDGTNIQNLYKRSLNAEIERAFAEGRAFCFPSIALDYVSDTWATYQYEQRETDRTLLALNSRKQQAQASVTTTAGLQGQVLGGGFGVAQGFASIGSAVNQIIDVQASYEEQDIKERGIDNQADVLITEGTNGLLFAYGMPMFQAVTLIMNDAEKEYYTNRVREQGNLIGSFVKNIDTRTHYAFDYIQAEIYDMTLSAPSDIKREIKTIYSHGVKIYHGNQTGSTSNPSMTVHDNQS